MDLSLYQVKNISSSNMLIKHKYIKYDIRDFLFWLEIQYNSILLQSLQDVTGAEFKMFMDFLKNLSIFGEKAPPERVQELIEIIEGQADLDAQFNVSNYIALTIPFSLPLYCYTNAGCCVHSKRRS